MTGTRKSDRLKDLLARAHHHADGVLEYLLALKNIFEPVHPEMAASLEEIMQVQVSLQDCMKAFWTEAWGSCPDTFDGYLS